MSTFFYVPQYFTTQLSVAGGIDDTQTTGIVLQDISGVDATKPGIIALTWSNPIDTTKIEYIFYTSINDSTNELVGVTRGQEGYSAKSHLNGATVAWPLSKSHINNIPDSTLTFTNKTFTSPLFNGTVDGWISANETWTYNAPDKLNVPSGAVTKYAKGDRLKFQNNDSGTNIYVAVVGVTNTVLTVFPAYVPNATLTDNFYSHEQSPIGYPHWFDFVPTTWAGIDNGSGGAPTINEARVRFDGNKATCHVRIVGTKDITSTVFTATVAPLPAINATNNLCALGSAYGYVNGTTDVTGIVMINTVWAFLFNISLTDNWSFVGGATWSYEF